MSRTAFSARDCQLVSSFQSIRDTLLQDRYRDRLAKPLAYWALPNDRRLPLAFLNRSIDDLINTSFDELSATPGIGRKKISSLIKLLMRATQDDPPTVPFGLTELSDSKGNHLRIDSGTDFDACLVSEALWSQWTTLVRELDFGDERLGRVAESLSTMPTVIWTKTLGEYENLTLAQIRGLRTHGEKRVRCVMQVFHRVFVVAQQYQHEGPESIRRHLGSRRILEISNWVNAQLSRDVLPSPEEVRSNFAEPVLRQIENDCGETVQRIAQQRIGIYSDPLSVREQAQAMGVTRARVYQLLDDCHKILEVRWPEGRDLLDKLTAKFGAHLGTSPGDASLFLAVRQLCFPDRIEQEAKPSFPSNNYVPHPHLGHLNAFRDN